MSYVFRHLCQMCATLTVLSPFVGMVAAHNSEAGEKLPEPVPSHTSTTASASSAAAPWVSLGGDIWDAQTRGRMVLFQPFALGATTLGFLEASGALDDRNVRQGRIVAGARRVFSGLGVAGVWGGFGGERSPGETDFYQISGGAEMLGNWFDVRVGGQFAGGGLGNGRFTPRVKLEGGRILADGLADVPLSGVDAEIGVRLPLKALLGDVSNTLDLRVYGGGFSYSDELALDDYSGGRLRGELRFNDFAGWPGARLTLSGKFEHSALLGSRGGVGVQFRVPLGASNLGATGLGGENASSGWDVARVADRLSDPVQQMRLNFAPLGNEVLVDTATDVRLDRVAVATTSGELNAAIGKGANTLIVADGRNSVFAGGITLKNDQTLVGGGGRLVMRGTLSGKEVAWTAPGEKATLRESTETIVTAAQNSHLVALDLDGANGARVVTNNGIDIGSGNTVVVEQGAIRNIGENAIVGGDNTKLTVKDQSISDITRFGILVRDRNAVSVSGSVIERVGATGIQTYFDSDLHVTDTTIRDAGADGIAVTDRTNITVTNSNILSSGEDAIDGNSGGVITVTDSLIDGVFDNALQLNDNNTLTLTGSTIRNVGDNAVLALNNNVINVTSTKIDTVTNAGIQFGDVNTVFVEDSEISNVRRGIDGFPGGNSSLTVTGTQIRSTVDAGIRLAENTVLTVSGSSFTDIGDDGIRLHENAKLDISNSSFHTMGDNAITAHGNTGIDIVADGLTVDDARRAIILYTGNTLDLRNSSISNSRVTALHTHENTTISISDVTITGSDGNAFRVDRPGNVIQMDGVTVGGVISQAALLFALPGNTFNGSGNTLAPGATLAAGLCQGAGNFAGTFAIAGTTLVNGGAPCF